ncbi:fasciclin domain-containing protein [Dyadobacter sp. CY345]|uniref:fasciclin domain-containing protein n=1 Tax=Dyadobacter sp. CY345 TaxID=2909335 RepID=UPI001F272D0F|nr:fasciclin domain-containing protein [Dyadobacter sp. CY345]MCF2445584.1 fasciclin domain-containing protein [Dyadobacter sp. CY345]
MKKINFIGRYMAIFLSVIVFTSIVTSCKENDDDIVKPKTITDVIMQNDEFSILREIILDNGLGDAFRTENVTFFAPNNAAFINSQVTAAMVNALPDTLARKFVFKHTLKGKIKYEELVAKTYSSYIEGDSIIVKTASASDPALLINGASVSTKNLNADNGIIQVVSRVLVPLPTK